MKQNIKFLAIVISLLLLSSIILTGCMYAIAEDNGKPKQYDFDFVSETVAEQGGSVIENSPTAQSDLQKKFSDMAEISKSGKAITVISEEFLDDYWRDIGNGKKPKALTSEEVMYIIQDSVRLYFEYDEYILYANSDYVTAHKKLLSRTAILDGTLTSFPLDENMLKNNFSIILSDIHTIILYRLAALSTPDAFIFADEAMIDSGGIFGKSIFYVPSDATVKDYAVLANFINGKVDNTNQIQIFDISYCGDTRIIFYSDGSNSDSVSVLYPTAEMEATQANRVVYIADRAEIQGIPTDAAEELFWETEKFEYYFPSVRSQYVIAIMYDQREMPLTEALKNGYITPDEFDDFDFEYIRKVKHEENNGEIYEYPFYGFNVQAVYTDKLRNDGIYPYANLINSAQQMENYTKEIKENQVYVTDRGTQEIPSYDEWVTKYTEEWFAENSLIIVVVEADSDVIPGICMVQIEPNRRIDLYMAEKSLGNKDDQVYTIFLEMSKIEADTINVFGDK